MDEKTTKRRSFLGALLAAPWVFLVGARHAAAGPAKLQAVPLCRCFIAGFQFHQGRAVLPTLVAGEPLVLQREPLNPHDSLAIAVLTAAGGKLGYLPRRLNEIPATLMDSGHSLAAVITSVVRDAPPWEMVEMEIRLG